MIMQKGSLAIVLLILVLIAAVLGGGYYFGMQKSSTTQSYKQNPTIFKTPEAIAIKSTLDIPSQDYIPSDWKTYTSVKHGFTIKYPAEAKIDPNKDNRYVLFLITGPTQKEQTELYDAFYLLFTSGSLDGKTLQEYTESQGKAIEGVGEVIKPISTIRLANLDGFTYRVRGLGEYTHILLSPKPNVFFEIIDGTNDPTDKGFNKIVEMMLSSLEVK